MSPDPFIRFGELGGLRIERAKKGFDVFEDGNSLRIGTIDRVGRHRLRWCSFRFNAMGTARTWREAAECIVKGNAT